ncbi:hypothetical protein FRC00_007651 [Tulasnella sp. 408]|nr:hypothetical protein FRC00_007651 [Tulasnella sp. 408]
MPAGLPPLADRQERQVVNPHQPHQAHKHKAHPLAMGSPSLTSIHNTRFSWDWNFSNPGSPRSTVYSKHETGGGSGHTPPASIRSVPHGAGSTDGHGVSPNGSVTSLPLHQIPHPPGVPHHPGTSGSHVRSRSRTSTSGSVEGRPNSTSPTRMRNHTRVPSHIHHHEPDVDEEEEENNAEEMRAIDAELERLGVVLSLSPQRAMFEEPLANDDDQNGGMDTPGGNMDDVLATPHMHAVMQPDFGEADQDALALPDVSSSASSLSPRTPPAGLSSGLLLENNPNDATRTAPVTILSASRPNTPRSSPTAQPFFGTKEPASGTATFKAPKSPASAAVTPTSSSGGATAMVKEGSRSRLWKKVKKALPDRRSSQSNIKESLASNTPASPLEGGDTKKFSTNASRMFKLERPWSRT